MGKGEQTDKERPLEKETEDETDKSADEQTAEEEEAKIKAIADMAVADKAATEEKAAADKAAADKAEEKAAEEKAAEEKAQEKAVGEAERETKDEIEVLFDCTTRVGLMLKESAHGFLTVVGCVKGSQAESLNVKEGWVLTKIDGFEVSSEFQVGEAIKHHRRPGSPKVSMIFDKSGAVELVSEEPAGAIKEEEEDAIGQEDDDQQNIPSEKKAEETMPSIKSVTKKYKSSSRIVVEKTLAFNIDEIVITEEEEKELKEYVAKGEWLLKYKNSGMIKSEPTKKFVYVDAEKGILYFADKETKQDAKAVKLAHALVHIGKSTQTMKKRRQRNAKSEKIFSVETATRSFDFGTEAKETTEKWVKALTVILHEHILDA